MSAADKIFLVCCVIHLIGMVGSFLIAGAYFVLHTKIPKKYKEMIPGGSDLDLCDVFCITVGYPLVMPMIFAGTLLNFLKDKVENV